MPVDCQRSTSGGKGNLGSFIDRAPRICAAGLPSAQPDDTVADALQHYLLKDEVDSLLSDAIVPSSPERPLPPLRHPLPMDKRNSGLFGDVAKLVNPPNKTKFQTVVGDMKDTPYASYWKKPLGQVRDPIPMFPEGFDISGTTYGKVTPFKGRLYDIVMPKDPLPDKTTPSQRPGAQLRRNYCEPAFNPDLTYGYRTNVDPRGIYAKCCLTDDNVLQGTSGRVITNSIQADFHNVTKSRIGSVLAPNENIKDVPPGYSFGILKPPDNLPECLTFCDLNSGRVFFRKCLAHLNSLRKVMSTRYLPTFFRKFYLNLKYFDLDKTGWLEKKIVYEFCGTKLIRFDPALIEPLLCGWEAFDGSKIEYKTFAHILNYKQPLPEIPNIPDFEPNCLDYRTTYTEMVKSLNETENSPMAGVPSGRYFDRDFPITPKHCCKAHRACLSQESDMKSCINPSILTLLGVSHRDMYQNREPHIIKRVFESIGEKFTEERFNAIWEEAKKYHSQGWVSYETFRRALENNVETGIKGNNTI